jgi:hypothetical protein
MFNYIVGARPTPKDWRESLETLRKGRETLQKHAPIMTQFERMTVENSIKENRDKDYPIIAGGITAEFNQAIESYQAAQKKYQAAQAAEINRWNDAGLTAARTNLLQQVDLITKNKDNVFSPGESAASKLQSLYHEMRQSGDMVKQRAAAEVCANLQGRDNITLATQAKSDLQTLRITPEMGQAENAIDAAQAALIGKHNELGQVVQDLDGINSPYNPFNTSLLAKEFRRLAADQEGNIIVRSYDDPAVSGVEKMTVKA